MRDVPPQEEISCSAAAGVLFGFGLHGNLTNSVSLLILSKGTTAGLIVSPWG